MNKSIFITGAASGVGLETAKLFHRLGWRLGLVDFDKKALKELEKELAGSKHFFAALDVCDAAKLKTTLDNFAKLNDGKIDVLFNSAGVLEIGDFTQIDLARHLQIIDVNIKGTLTACYQAVAHLKNTPGAKIINMSSASSIQGTPLFASYSASKFAVRGLTEALNVELEQHGIEVCAIMPPFVDTPMVQNQSVTPPITNKLGAHISAADVAQKVHQICMRSKNPVNNPLTFLLKATIVFTKFLPSSFNRFIMKQLSK